MNVLLKYGSLVFRMYEECRVKPAQIPGRMPFGETHMLQRALMRFEKDLRQVLASLRSFLEGSGEVRNLSPIVFWLCLGLRGHLNQGIQLASLKRCLTAEGRKLPLLYGWDPALQISPVPIPPPWPKKKPSPHPTSSFILLFQSHPLSSFSTIFIPPHLVKMDPRARACYNCTF